MRSPHRHVSSSDCGRPVLDGRVLLRWPKRLGAGFVLQQNSNLANLGGWTGAPAQVEVADYYEVTISDPELDMFRLTTELAGTAVPP